MQIASSNFSEALSAGTVTFAPPKLMADWTVDGYGVVQNLIAPTLFHDDFSRVVVDDWGTAADGRIWFELSQPASAYSVTGSAGRHAVPSSFATQWSFLDHDGGDLDYSVKFITYALATGDNYQATILARHDSFLDTYLFCVQFNTDQTISLAIKKIVGGSVTLIDSVTSSLTHVANIEYAVRVQCSGTTLRMRLWETVRQLEQPGWDVEAEDSTFTNGQVGVRTEVGFSNSNTKPLVIDYTDFRVVDTGLVDDISDLAGGPFEVSHVLDDGYPDSVSFVAGLGTAELSVPLVGGRDSLRVSEYFSEFNEDSPVYGYDRDVPPVKLDIGVVTEGGSEYIRIFTGQMTEIPVSTGKAVMKAMSSARLKMAKLIRPPIVLGAREGANATWLISYAMLKSGVYVSPPPGDGVEWYAPMHGSLHPMIPEHNQLDSFLTETPHYANHWTPGTVITGFGNHRPTFQEGPFVLAPVAGINSDEAFFNTSVPDFVGTNHLFSQFGNCGRLEFWIRGDAADSTAYVADGGFVSKIAGFRFFHSNNTELNVGVGDDFLDRKVYVHIFDGTTNFTVKSSASLPTDGQWYFVGAAWDIAGNKAWVNFNGTVQSSQSSPALSVAGLTVFDTPGNNVTPNWISYLPAAEVRLTGNVFIASPDLNPVWANTQEWDLGAVLQPSEIEYEVISESAEREAWSVVGDIALSELATMRPDENDVVQYLVRSHWAQDDQLAISDSLSTDKNISEIVIDTDPSRIRNSISVKFSERVVSGRTFVFNGNTADPILIPTGTTDYEFGLDSLAAFVSGEIIDPTSAVTNYNNGTQYLTANRLADGSGTYASVFQVYAQVIRWDSVSITLRIVNLTGLWYLSNNLGIPPLGVRGNKVIINDATAVKRIQDSIDRRGERALVVELKEIQTRNDAARVANRLGHDLAYPSQTLGEIEIFGDPRRQPGDLVSFEDSADTKIDGPWRLSSVVHTIDGPKYTQKVRVQRHLVPTPGVWGVTRWSRSVWGRD